MLDAVTFEVLRHRLEAFNEEAAISVMRIAGSQIVTESFDLNSALMNAEGDVILTGTYVLVHSPALNGVVEHVLSHLSENPGIGPGDMFITNDPYVTGRHQLDTAVVAPIFDGELLVAWCGTVVHQSDVGGPVAGSYSPGARSIYEEAIPMAPCRIVEGGHLRRDIEHEYLIRSRTRELNQLDLLGQIAANRLHSERILSLCAEYGADTFTAALQRLVDGTEALLRARLRELPDGRWRHAGYIEHDGVEDRVYPVRLTMTKSGDHLDLDFTESADQAPALINAPLGTLRAFGLVALMALLGYDGVPWVPAAFERVVTFRTRPGSVVHATWPAGVAMSGTAAGQEIRTALNVCIARMLDASEAHSRRILAPGMTSAPGQTINGLNAAGTAFSTTLLDAQLGGGGARYDRDGADTAGLLHVPGGACANVEVNEANHPMLYLWRRERPDSGGPGLRRGGVGGEHAWQPHRARGPIGTVLFAHGVDHRSSAGVLGGEFGMPNSYLFLRGQAGRVLEPQDIDAAGGRELPPPKMVATLAPADVFSSGCAGGGGLGDPLLRDPQDVLRDIEEGLVTATGAAADYGVAVRPESGGWVVDGAATTDLRRQRRRLRLGADPARTPLPDGAPGRRLGSGLVLFESGTVGCAHCGHELGPAADNVKTHLAVEETAAHDHSDRFVTRRYHCTGCATQLDVEVALAGEPPLWSVDVLAATGRANPGDRPEPPPHAPRDP